MQRHPLARRSFLRQSAATVIGLAGTALLAACSAAATTTPTPTTGHTSTARAQSTSGAAAAATASSARAAAPASTGRAVAGCTAALELWAIFGPGTPQNAGITALAQRFPGAQSGCTVNIAVVPQKQIQDKVTTAVAGGVSPAITMLAPAQVPTWSAAGLLASVDDLFRRDKLQATDFPAPLWTQMNYGGKVWFMQLFANGDFVLFWNKQHFREAGLPVDTGPQTVQELDAMIQKLTVWKGSTLQRMGAMPWNVYGDANTLLGWGYAFGGSFYDTAKHVLTFNNPQVVSAVQWYTGWAKRIGTAQVSQLLKQAPTGNLSLLGKELVSIAPITDPDLRVLQQKAPSVQLGAGVMPGNPPGKPGSVTIGGWGFGAVQGNPQREGAWDFMRFASTSDDGTRIVAEKIGAIPGYLKSPALDELAKDPYQAAYVAAVRRAQHVQIGFYAPVSIGLSPIQDVINGKQDAATAMASINQTTNAALQQYEQQLQKKGG